MLAAAALAMRNRRRILAAAAGLVAAMAAPIAVAITAIAGSPAFPTTASVASPEALRDIPVEALGAYQEAAATYGIDWALLAAIGKLECDHGRSQLAGCTPDTINLAGARGFMQMLGSTWRRELGPLQLEPRDSPPAGDGDGYATDGDGDGRADPWSWPDAAFSAARLLAADSAATDPPAAVFAYNHDNTYVSNVLNQAARYRDTTSQSSAAFSSEVGTVPLVTVDGITVHAQIGGQVAALIAAARVDGLNLGGSGYRSTEQQVALRRAHCGTSNYAIFEMPAGRCSPPTAPPGESLHERGLAIDFTCDGALVVTGDRCFDWLAGHAARFGLFNLASESWHWSVDGR